MNQFSSKLKANFFRCLLNFPFFSAILYSVFNLIFINFKNALKSGALLEFTSVNIKLQIKKINTHAMFRAHYINAKHFLEIRKI